MKKYIFIVFFLFNLSSCDKLNKDSYPIIQKRFKLGQNGMNDAYLIEVNNNFPITYGHILFYASNSKFIIIDEKPRDSIVLEKDKLNMIEADNKFYKTKFSQFKIIDLKRDSVYGPYKKEEYLKKRKMLNVPEKLKFDHSTLEIYVTGQRGDVEYLDLDNDVIDVKNLKGNDVSKIIN